MVAIRRNFFRADANGDANGDANVTLEEWTDFKSGRSPRVFVSIFALADFDEDGELAPDEFGYYYARGTANEKIMARFSVKDDNDDGVLTRDEWNPGVRPGSGPL